MGFKSGVNVFSTKNLKMDTTDYITKTVGYDFSTVDKGYKEVIPSVLHQQLVTSKLLTDPHPFFVTLAAQ